MGFVIFAETEFSIYCNTLFSGSTQTEIRLHDVASIHSVLALRNPFVFSLTILLTNPNLILIMTWSRTTGPRNGTITSVPTLRTCHIRRPTPAATPIFKSAARVPRRLRRPCRRSPGNANNAECERSSADTSVAHAFGLELLR